MSTPNYYPASTVIPIYSVYLGVGIALTGLRTWVRTVYARLPLGTDDYFIYLALATSAACTAIQYFNELVGTGGAAVTDPDSKAHGVIISHEIDWAQIVIEKIGFGAVKLSILFFYRRIFGVWKSFRIINNALIWFVGLWAFVFCLSDILICGSEPWRIWSWDQTLSKEKCGNRGAQLLAFSVTSVATDLPILLLPFFYIRRLQMAPDKKIASIFVFFLGTISIGASVIRLIFLIVSYPAGRLDFAYEPPPADKTPLVLEIFNPTFWAITELWLAVWAANLPPCGPLLKEMNIHPARMFSSIYKRSRKSSSATAWTSWRRPSEGFTLSKGSKGSRAGSKAYKDNNFKTPLEDNSHDEAQLVDMGSKRSERWASDTTAGKRNLSTSSKGSGLEAPPQLKPVDWTGGRISSFSRLSSQESGLSEEYAAPDGGRH
ncbi:hypothetical protein F5Y16DRAFT_127934 [Xylariaceae sp. FL0255]|nr:hypothetical protein F5Y16DRAFT_127934 [Xylariaceae sp. FL0255]